MPEPRDMGMGGEIIIGYKGGGAESWNEYGHRPWEEGYKDDKREAEESKTLRRFQAEWSAMQGPTYRGTSFQFHRTVEGPHVVSDEYYRHDLERARKYRHLPRATR